LPVSYDLLRWHESLTIKPQIHTFTFAQHNKSKAFSWLLGKFSDNLTPIGVSKLVYEERELVYETDLFPEDTPWHGIPGRITDPARARIMTGSSGKKWTTEDWDDVQIKIYRLVSLKSHVLMLID
jgi:hypothetical protein